MGFGLKARTGFSGAVPGTTTRGTAGLLTATGTTRQGATLTTGSGLSCFQLTWPGGCRPADQDSNPVPVLSGQKGQGRSVLVAGNRKVTAKTPAGPLKKQGRFCSHIGVFGH